MGHVPVLVDRVPGEPAPELVVDAAGGHRLERALDDLERGRIAVPDVDPQQEVEQQRLGKLRSGAEAAVPCVEDRRQPFGGFLLQQVRPRDHLLEGGRGRRSKAIRDHFRQ